MRNFFGFGSSERSREQSIESNEQKLQRLEQELFQYRERMANYTDGKVSDDGAKQEKLLEVINNLRISQQKKPYETFRQFDDHQTSQEAKNHPESMAA